MENHLFLRNFYADVECKDFLIGSCPSAFEASNLQLRSGVNVISGDIDGGGWTLSYLLSYPKDPSIILWENGYQLEWNGIPITLAQLADLTVPIGARSARQSPFSIKTLVRRALRKSKLPYSAEEVLEIFTIPEFLWNRKLLHTGSRLWKCQAAIGFAGNRPIFCFPWMSRRRLDPLIVFVNQICSELKKRGNPILIMPVSKAEMVADLADYWIDADYFLSNRD
ncbi:hypothetical protein [Yeguia hominis]|uniref:Uncharacterized protein n=1 Tax=Yeguia hominis TaxID=2763662 RepID=A0A926DBG1_9FIRM|nr:hypothetical protein [Yeguia hominis]MBC8535003.1 hypothetical protein [Yeguia hominis]